MKHLQPIAILIASLVIFLPIYSANVFAENRLEVISRSGTENIEGYVRNKLIVDFTGDALKISVAARLDEPLDPEINPNQVRIGGPPGLPFTTCSPRLDYFICDYTLPIYKWDAIRQPLIIYLFSDEDVQVLDTPTYVTLDNLAPEIEFIGTPVQSLNNVKVEYRITDRACVDPSCQGECSGINRIEFWDGGNEFEEFEIVLDTPECVYPNTTILPVPSTGSIIIKAYDRVGQMSRKTSPEFTLDLSPPVIDKDSFKITTDDMEIIEYLKPGIYTIDVSVEIEEKSLTKENVTIDLSDLGLAPDLPATSCTIKYGDIYECEWTDLSIDITGGVTANIVITAQDDFGNTATETITKTFRMDNIAPVITAFKTDYVYNGKSHLGSAPTNITVLINEQGAGFYQRNIELDLSELGPYPDYINCADVSEDECNCTEISTGKWACKWFDIITDRDTDTPTIWITDAKDDVGNPAALPPETTETNVCIDKIEPVINNISIFAIRGIREIEITPSTPPLAAAERTTYYMSNDDLEIIANITDTTCRNFEPGITAYADLSPLKGYRYKNVPTRCEKQDSAWLCIWSVENIASGYKEAILNFTFYDVAHNPEINRTLITIYGLDIEETPDYWTYKDIDNETDIQPKRLDRQTIPLINQRIFFHITLLPQEGIREEDISTLDISLVDCVEAGGTAYIKEKDIFNNIVGSKEPFIALELKTISEADLKDLNEISVTCTLQIISLYVNRVSNIELEDINLTIGFYNMPLGEISSEIKGKIDHLYDKYIEGWPSWVGKIYDVFEFASSICNMIQTWRQITFLKERITHGIGTAERGIKVSKAREPVKRTRSSFCRKTEAAKRKADDFFTKSDMWCSAINCKLDPNSPMDKWAKIIGGTVRKPEEWLGADKLKDWTGKVTVSVGKKGAEEAYSRFRSPGGYMNVRDNIFLSVLMARPPCLAGIIYNLEKYRQIQCMYIDCLQNSINTGASQADCARLRDYQQCKYIYGEIFQAIPLFALWDYYVDMIKDALSDPFSVIGIWIAARCEHLCDAEDPQAPAWCIWPKLMAEIGDSLMNIENFKARDEWKIKEDYCKNVEKRGR